MAIRIKIWHFLLLLWLVLLILRLDMFYHLAILAKEYLVLIISEGFTLKPDLQLIDLWIELAVFILMLPFGMYAVKHFSFMSGKLKFYNVFCIVLLYFFVFVPVLTKENPDNQKNLSVTRLLPPLSTVKVLCLNSVTGGSGSGFRSMSRRIINLSDAQRVFMDSMSYGDKTFIYQKGKKNEIEAGLVELNQGKPVIKNKTFLFGSDELGRDIFVRVMYGIRTSLLTGICASVISFIIGLLAGFLAGYYGGAADVVLSRFAESFLTFPVIFLVLLILALFGNSFGAVIFVLGISGWMSLFKIVKSETIVIKNKEYFITSRMLGLRKRQLIFSDLLPVLIIPVAANLVLQVCNVIMAESALGYLGLGVGESYPTWGSMIQSGQEYIYQAWWLVFFPGVMIVLTVQAIRGLGNSISCHYNTRLANDK